mgnify:CR=1 FL=1
MRYQGDFCPGDDIELEFYMTDDTRKIEAHGIIIYANENCFTDIKSTGVLFVDISEINQKRIDNAREISNKLFEIFSQNAANRASREQKILEEQKDAGMITQEQY